MGCSESQLSLLREEHGAAACELHGFLFVRKRRSTTGRDSLLLRRSSSFGRGSGSGKAGKPAFVWVRRYVVLLRPDYDSANANAYTNALWSRPLAKRSARAAGVFPCGRGRGGGGDWRSGHGERGA